MSKKQVKFTQFDIKDGIASGLLELPVPAKLSDLADVEYSINGKLLPSYEGEVKIEVTLADGTVTEISGSVALWFNKKHIKSAKEAAEKEAKAAKEAAEKAEKQAAMMELLKQFTPEQIEMMSKLGFFK